MSGRLIVVSNRIPTEAQPAGGLVVTLHDLLRETGGLWIGMHPEIGADDAQDLVEIEGAEYRKLAFRLSQQQYDDYYLGFSNSVLWPVCHRRGDLVSLRRRYEKGYTEVNTRMARQIAALVRPDDLIWVHDYHFFPLAMELRKLGVSARIGFFLHIPFPALGDLGALSPGMNLARMLAAYDLVGLQTRADVARCLEMFRADRHAEFMLDGAVKYAERTVSVRSFPIGIDVDEFAGEAAKAPDRFALDLGLKGNLLIGVDRLDYSKGLPNRFRAFGRYLAKRGPESRRASLLQIAPPTREQVPAYRQIQLELEELAGRLNGEYSELDWTPLRYIHRAVDRAKLAALYRAADAALVTPFADGMNLVAKEFVVAQDPVDPGVLILSRMAGAAEDMTEALLVNPYDIEEMSDAIAEALNMPRHERQRRHAACMEVARDTDVSKWGGDFLAALARRPPTLGLRRQPLDVAKS